jgi:hypothetical protein
MKEGYFFKDLSQYKLTEMCIGWEFSLQWKKNCRDVHIGTDDDRVKTL